MIDDNLIKRIQLMIDKHESLHPQLTHELLDNYISLVKQNAKLHKEIAKLKTEVKELYQESARDKGL